MATAQSGHANAAAQQRRQSSVPAAAAAASGAAAAALAAPLPAAAAASAHARWPQLLAQLADTSSSAAAIDTSPSAAPDFASLGTVVGIGLGGLFCALWLLERGATARLAGAVASTEARAAEAEREAERMRGELAAEAKARKDAESLRPRLDAASRDIMKLEKALEIKDGQLDVFINTARRQIKALEEDLKEAQRAAAQQQGGGR